MHKKVLIISASPRRGGRGRRPQIVAAFPSFCIDARPSPIAGGKNPQAAGQGRLPQVGRAGAGGKHASIQSCRSHVVSAPPSPRSCSAMVCAIF